VNHIRSKRRVAAILAMAALPLAFLRLGPAAGAGASRLAPTMGGG
jgi:hypothetical protein